MKHSLDSWYAYFSNWVSIGSCSVVTASIVPGQKIVLPEAQFYDCLQEWFLTDFGRNKKNDIVMEDGKISGWREYVTPIKTENLYEDGRTYLTDMRRVLGQYGIEKTYAYSKDLLTMEMFVVLVKETVISCASSIAAIFCIVMLITCSLRISLLVLLCVVQTDYFLCAMLPLFDLTFNNVVAIYLLTSLGLSVLYAMQFSHKFLNVDAPDALDRKE